MEQPEKKAFVHTTSFSLPVENDTSKTTLSVLTPSPLERILTETKALLENALTSCAQLSRENNELHSKNKELSDQVLFLKQR